MDTLIHHTHYLAGVWQLFLAALAMLGMGLAGQSAELGEGLTVSRVCSKHKLCHIMHTDKEK